MASKIQEVINQLRGQQKDINTAFWKLFRWVEIIDEGGIHALSSGELDLLADELHKVRDALQPYSN